MCSLVILSCLIAAATACVPMKHPDPGMPATPPPGPKCADRGTATAAECPAECVAPLTMPTITQAKITCSTGALCLLNLVGGAYVHSYNAVSAYCTADGWFDTKFDAKNLAMIILLPILVYASVPLLVHAGSNCPQVDEQLEQERIQDEAYHKCRNCKAFEQDDAACPEVGYECNIEWKMKANVLPPDGCTCSEIRCADTKATLAVDGQIVHKLRCNSSAWVTEDGESGPAVCAKRCNVGTCSHSNPNANRYKYRPLIVEAATTDTKCDTATCDHTMAVLNEDGTLDRHLSNVETISCSSEGLWKTGSDRIKYVMCEPLPCQTCDTSLLIDPSHPACSTQTDIICTQPPYLANKDDECLTLGCGDNGLLYLLINATMNVASSNAKCDQGTWKLDPEDSSVPDGAIGFVCAKPNPKCADRGTATVAECPAQCVAPHATPAITRSTITCSSGELCLLNLVDGAYVHSYNAVAAYCTVDGWYDTKFKAKIGDIDGDLWACCTP